MDNGEHGSRVARSRGEAGAVHGRLSRWYDLLTEPWEKPFREAGLQKLAVQDGERVLEIGEIGFETGHALVDLARSAGFRGRVWGVDVSCPIGIAPFGEESRATGRAVKERIRQADLSRRVNLMCADADALPLQDGAFDVLFMAFTLELFDVSRIPPVLHECRRVLHERGRMCVVSLAKRAEFGWMTRLYDWIHARFPSILDRRPIYVEEVVEGAGFRIADVDRGAVAGLDVDVVLAHQPALGEEVRASSRGSVVVDGANVAYSELSEDGESRVANLVAVRRALEQREYDPIVIVDASLRHHVDDPAWLERLIEGQAVRQAPAGTDADYFVLETADRLGSLVVSNDTFDRFRDRYPWIEQRRVPLMIIRGEVELYEQKLDEDLVEEV